MLELEVFYSAPAEGVEIAVNMLCYCLRLLKEAVICDLRQPRSDKTRRQQLRTALVGIYIEHQKTMKEMAGQVSLEDQ